LDLVTLEWTAGEREREIIAFLSWRKKTETEG